jgi:hypothetical protein
LLATGFFLLFKGLQDLYRFFEWQGVGDFFCGNLIYGVVFGVWPQMGTDSVFNPSDWSFFSHGLAQIFPESVFNPSDCLF